MMLQLTWADPLESTVLAAPARPGRAGPDAWARARNARRRPQQRPKCSFSDRDGAACLQLPALALSLGLWYFKFPPLRFLPEPRNRFKLPVNVGTRSSRWSKPGGCASGPRPAFAEARGCASGPRAMIWVHFCMSEHQLTCNSLTCNIRHDLKSTEPTRN
jgi:hypothetical protein